MRLITHLTVLLWLLGVSAQACATEQDTPEFGLLLVLFLTAFTLILVVSSLPRPLRADVVSPEILHAFALSKGLVEAKPGPSSDDSGSVREAFRRWWSSNPAVKRPANEMPVYRGNHGGLPFMIDVVQVNRWFGNAWQRQPVLRMIIELPEAPRTLQVYPARVWDGLAGRSGLLRSKMPARNMGSLVARFSKRPVDRAKERIFLNDERRRILEAFEAQTGGIHIHDGKLFVVRGRFEVTAADLNPLYDDVATLAKTLAAHT